MPERLTTSELIGSYRLQQELGRGGMGIVFEAAHAILPRRAAIKIMHAGQHARHAMAARMLQEAAILEEVRHPGIVRVYECGVLADERPWFAMELVEGETLARRLQEVPRLAAIEVATLLADVADVLAVVHARGIVHRDLKPENLLLTPGDRDFPLRVIDWGVSHLGPGQRMLDGFTSGTPAYMSPEQATGDDVGAACDLYALGVIAYEALAGRPPFEGRSLAEVAARQGAGEPSPLDEYSDAPRELCALIHRMLARDPELRPSAIEVRELARTIRAAISDALPGAVRSRVVPRGLASDTLEHGATELMAIPREPRWTPDAARRSLRSRSAAMARSRPRWRGVSIRMSGHASPRRSRRSSSPNPRMASRSR